MSAHVRGTLYKETVSGNRGQTEKDCIAALNQHLEDQTYTGAPVHPKTPVAR